MRELANYGPWAKDDEPPFFSKSYFSETAILIGLYIVYGSFSYITAELDRAKYIPIYLLTEKVC